VTGPDTFSITAKPRPGSGIPLATVPNLRNLGGWPTPNAADPSGTVRRGLVFRSAQFSDLTGADAAAFADLGITAVFDLRTEAERARTTS
jgi:protein-tyrosine phosphatase